MSMKKEITFVIEGRPKGKARPRFTKAGIAYNPKSNKKYEQLVKDSYLAKEKQLNQVYKFDNYISINIVAHFKVAKANKDLRLQLKENKTLYCDMKPDSDNIAKIIMDGLNGVAYDDDKQIVNMNVTKLYSDTSYTQVTISEV